jgi:hypothetical protein
MEPVPSVEAHVVPFAVKGDLCTTVVGIAEEEVEHPPPEATAGRYRRQVVDLLPGGGRFRQLGHQQLLVLVRVERTPTGHEPAESDDGEPAPATTSPSDPTATRRAHSGSRRMALLMTTRTHPTAVAASIPYSSRETFRSLSARDTTDHSSTDRSVGSATT